jgi:predicted CXXCH cytochrome family protein
MRALFGHGEHLVRVAGLFLAGIVAFVVLRSLLIPQGFGEYGHYRTGAIEDNRARPVAFAGRAACLDCHDDAAQAAKGGGHAGVRCEACHGPLAAHAAEPTEKKAERPDAAALCVRCHEANVARPTGFPQKDAALHAGGETCTTCHVAHKPGMGGDEKAPGSDAGSGGDQAKAR